MRVGPQAVPGARRRLLAAALGLIAQRGALAHDHSGEATRASMSREREQLLVQGEAALARGKVSLAIDAFERAAQIRHAADAEIPLVRAYMQAGDYRRALTFGAHTAGDHRQSTGAAALYAWLLALGGQLAAAESILDGASQDQIPDPLLAQVRQLLAISGPQASAPLPAPPLRLAPYATGAAVAPHARVASSALLVDQGRHALAPLAAFDLGSRKTSLWLRDGLGRTTGATLRQRVDPLGLALLRLDQPLTADGKAGGIALAERPPFPGSPAYVVEFAPAASAAPSWPRLYLGFTGAPVEAAAARHLGVDLPTGLHGGPVFDGAAQLTGVAMAHADGRNRLLGATDLVPYLGSMPMRPMPASANRRLPTDEIYEAAMQRTLQLIVAQLPKQRS